MMVKEARPGRVKTRLSKNIGSVAAARWYRRSYEQVLRRLDHDPRWQIFLAVSPDICATSCEILPDHIPRLPQGAGDLGARMRRIFKTLPAGPVLIIGSDIPAITSDDIWKSFRLLDSQGAVFGPSPDGGYWLVGMGRHRRYVPSHFQNVRWSSPHALADSIASVNGRNIQFTSRLADVDTGDDLRPLHR